MEDSLNIYNLPKHTKRMLRVGNDNWRYYDRWRNRLFRDYYPNAEIRKTTANPERPAVYFLWNKDKLVYIGFSKSVSGRLLQHWEKSMKDKRYKWDTFSFLPVNYYEGLVLEPLLINKYKPDYNSLNITNISDFEQNEVTITESEILIKRREKSNRRD